MGLFEKPRSLINASDFRELGFLALWFITVQAERNRC